MIQVTDTIFIDEKELQWEFVRASGPGGQNVNKVATAAQLRFDVINSPSLSPYVKERLIKFAGRKMTLKGELIIEAQRFRYQESNREDALNRLIALIQKAAFVPKTRRKTKPSLASKQKRMQEKHIRAEKKQSRQRVKDFD